MIPNSVAAFLLTLVLSHQIFPFSSLPEKVPSVSIANVIANRVYLDGKKVTVEGVVKKLRFTVSNGGRAYTLFRIYDGDDNSLGVYSKGKLPIENGDLLRITGKFKKEKQYVIFRFKNILKAKVIRDLSNGEMVSSK